MDLLKEVHQAQIEHGRLLATLVGSNDCSCKTPMTPTDLVSSPFKTYQNLKSVDSLLTGEVADAFVRELQRLQGSNLGATTRRIMAHLLTDELGSQFSWLGRKGKENFSELKLSGLILRKSAAMEALLGRGFAAVCSSICILCRSKTIVLEYLLKYLRKLM